MFEREIDTVSPDSPVETVGDQELIGSDRIEGIAVYGTERRKIGRVHNLMVNRRTGTVAHVIVSDRGFLGFGRSRFIRVPWGDLSYEPRLGGYATRLKQDVMQSRGRISADEAEMQLW